MAVAFVPLASRVEMEFMMPPRRLNNAFSAVAPARTWFALLTIAMLPSVAAAAAVFGVAAGPPASGNGCDGNIISISGSATPVSVDHTCGNGLGSTSSNANATFGSVGTAARSATISNTTQALVDESSASFRDTLVFSKTDPNLSDQFSVSLNLALAGILNAGAPLGGAGSAGLEIDVSFLGQWVFDVNYAADGSLNYGAVNIIVKTGTLAPGAAGFDVLLATPLLGATIGSHEFEFSIYTRAFSLGTSASATADFLHTLKLPTGVDVFTLPPGYTVNAGDYLVNNRFTNGAVSVPEPGTVGLLGVGLAALVGFRRRCSAGMEGKEFKHLVS